MPELPAGSPRPAAPEFENADPSSPVTGVHPATRDFVREVNRTGLWKTSWALIITAAALVTGAIWTYREARAQARDAGVEAANSVQRQANEQGEQLKRLQADFTAHVEVEAQHRVRVEKKLNAMLDHFDVKDPAPTPKDAGHP